MLFPTRLIRDDFQARGHVRQINLPTIIETDADTPQATARLSINVYHRPRLTPRVSDTLPYQERR